MLAYRPKSYPNQTYLVSVKPQRPNQMNFSFADLVAEFFLYPGCVQFSQRSILKDALQVLHKLSSVLTDPLPHLHSRVTKQNWSPGWSRSALDTAALGQFGFGLIQWLTVHIYVLPEAKMQQEEAIEMLEPAGVLPTEVIDCSMIANRGDWLLNDY